MQLAEDKSSAASAHTTSNVKRRPAPLSATFSHPRASRDGSEPRAAADRPTPRPTPPVAAAPTLRCLLHHANRLSILLPPPGGAAISGAATCRRVGRGGRALSGESLPLGGP
eukprot:scaffold13642_cov148-Isochrysis_galbana.AAC.1